MRMLRWFIALSLILGGGLVDLSAQVMPTNPNRPTGGQGGGFGQNDYSTNPFGQAPSGFGPDSAGTDSFYQGEQQIKPETRWVEPRRLFAHQEFRPLATPDLAYSYHWDPLQRVDGFVQSLGQIGKPYQVWFEGAAERFYDRHLWWDGVMGRYDRQIGGPLTGVKYYDTRTPYVDVHYTQGPDKLLLTDVTASQNITPFWNMSLKIRRHLAEGAYRSFVTDQTNLWLSSNYRSQNRRYYLFANLTLNGLNNQIHGGVPRAPTGFSLQDGAFLDNLDAYNQSFFKGFSSPLMSEGSLNRNVRGGVVDQYYHLIGRPDSTSKHRLTLRGVVSGEQNFRRFTTQSTNFSPHLLPVLPTLASDASRFDSDFTAWQGRAAAEGSYTWRPRDGFRVHAQGGISYQLINLSTDSALLTNQNITDQYVSGELRSPWLAVSGHFKQRVSTRFSAQREVGARALLYPLVRRGTADTATSPLQVFAQVDLDDLNPSLFQTYVVGDSGNAYLPNPNLENQLRFYASGGIGLREVNPVRRGDTLLPMHLRIKGFYQRFDRQIYYDSAFSVRQAPAGEPMQWVGLSVEGRLRLWRHFFIETYTSGQLGSVNSNTPSRQWMARSLPLVNGRTGLYYDHRDVSWAEQARIGLEVFYHTPYLGQTVDPWSGEFYPTNYQMLPYARVDAFAALRLMGVYVFLRYHHVNELLLVNGYYTTPFYPMLERALTFGVKWQFFN